jgi:outer membrane protein OmpA-like peptidoglycan-associated protein
MPMSKSARKAHSARMKARWAEYREKQLAQAKANYAASKHKAVPLVANTPQDAAQAIHEKWQAKTRHAMAHGQMWNTLSESAETITFDFDSYTVIVKPKKG